MRKKRILVVGAGREQVAAIVMAREMGFEVFASDRNPAAPGFAFADHVFVVSTTDVEGNLAVVRQHAIDGVMTLISETAVPVVAEIARAFGLPGLSADTVRWATDKVAMRRRFRDSGVSQPLFAVIEDAADAAAEADRIGYPLVVKPSINSGQRGITLVRQPSQLQQAVAEAALYAPDGILLCEQYKEGREINVTAVVIGGVVHILSLSDRKIYPWPVFGVAYAHYFPAQLSREEEEWVVRCAKEAIVALQMQNGIAYPQIIVNSEGAFLVEIAARIPGGNMREVALYASGIDLVEVAILQSVGALGALEELHRSPQSPALCVRFLTTNEANVPVGEVKAVSGVDEAGEVDGVVRAECYLRPGDMVESVKHSTHRYVVVIARGKDLTTAVRQAEKAVKSIRITVR